MQQKPFHGTRVPIEKCSRTLTCLVTGWLAGKEADGRLAEAEAVAAAAAAAVALFPEPPSSGKGLGMAGSDEVRKCWSSSCERLCEEQEDGPSAAAPGAPAHRLSGD